jgi:hypothetical protein
MFDGLIRGLTRRRWRRRGNSSGSSLRGAFTSDEQDPPVAAVSKGKSIGRGREDRDQEELKEHAAWSGINV